jgi:hypothetical protein
MAAIVGVSSVCCFLFLAEAGITCRPDRTWPWTRKVTGKRLRTRATRVGGMICPMTALLIGLMVVVLTVL